MRRTSPGPWPAIAAVVVVEALFLLTAIPLALRVPTVKTVPALPASLELDYSTLHTDGVAPLEASFIKDILGIDLENRSIEAARDEEGVGSDLIAGPGSAGFEGTDVAPTRLEHPFTNDDFTDAVTIPRVPFTLVTDTTGASRESGEPDQCSAVGGTVWYRFTSPRDLGLTADTFGTDYATALAVFSGNRLSDLRLLRCEKDARGNSQTGFPARAGKIYYFQVTGLVTGGKLNFNLHAQGSTVLASRPDDRGEASDSSGEASLSENGRYVAFSSAASNLVSGDTNVSYDVFVRDLLLKRTERVSVSSSGEQGNGSSFSPSISGDGRYIAFDSNATNLVDNVPVCISFGSPCYQVYVHDRVTGGTRLVSRSSSGEAGNSNSWFASISSDGSHVAFSSWASDLVKDDDNKCTEIGFGEWPTTVRITERSCSDIFVHNLGSRRTSRVSVSSSGAEGDDGSWSPSISATGRYVAFESKAGNLVGETVGGFYDIFVHDRKRRTTKLISFDHTGTKGARGSHHDPQISGDGRYVTFRSNSEDLTRHHPTSCVEQWDWYPQYPGDPCTHVYVRDRVAEKTIQVSVASSGEQANHHSLDPDISSDGRFITFTSAASNLVAGDSNGTARCSDSYLDGPPSPQPCLDVFVRDLLTRTTSRVSVASTGRQGSDTSFAPRISLNGSHVSFTSAATNLTGRDTNRVFDVFVHRRLPGR